MAGHVRASSFTVGTGMSTTLSDPQTHGPPPLFTPAAATISASQTDGVHPILARTRPARPIADSDALYRFSIEDVELFWQTFLRFSKLVWEGDASPVCTSERVETARFFPRIRLSYPENLLACNSPEDLQRAAVTARDANGVTERLTRGRTSPAGPSTSRRALRALGVSAEDRVVSVLRNDAGSGRRRTWLRHGGSDILERGARNGRTQLCSADSANSIPAVLIVSSIDGPGFETSQLRELALGLPTLRSIVVLDAGPAPDGFSGSGGSFFGPGARAQ